MSDLPRPLTPPDCDLRGYDWMRLMGHRMFSSSWYRVARKDGRGGIASLKLWWVAMLQIPAGSLPNDEEELCMLADFGEDMRAWRKHRLVAMHGFILCSDNRWYHRVVAEEALRAYNCKLKKQGEREATAERTRRWRENHNGSQPPEKPNGYEIGDASPSPSQTPSQGASPTPHVTGDVTVRARASYETVNEKKEPPPKPPPVPEGGADEVIVMLAMDKQRRADRKPRNGRNPPVIPIRNGFYGTIVADMEAAKHDPGAAKIHPAMAAITRIAHSN